MTMRRLIAAIASVAMIAGAFVLRRNVIDSDSDGAGRSEAAEVVCAAELAAACNQIRSDYPNISFRTAQVATTVDRLATSADGFGSVWLTLEPFTAVVDQERAAQRRTPIVWSNERIASSPIAAVSLTDISELLSAECGPALRWVCLGDITGRSWEGLGGTAAQGTVRPAFAPLNTAVGQLGVTAAVSDWFDGRSITAADPAFISWARPITRAVSASALSGTTAIGTIQSRPSSLNIAIGVAAELAPGNTERFSVLYDEAMHRADVIVAAPDGITVPNGLVSDLSAALRTAGWDLANHETNPLNNASTLIAIRDLWEDLS